MKEKKTEFIKVRVSKSEKEQIYSYCEKHSLSVSEFIRLAINIQMAKESK